MKKKTIIICLLAVSILLICFFGGRLAEKARMNQITTGGELLCNMYPVKTYFYEENFCVVVFENGKPIKCVEFSDTRQPVHAIGAEPVTVSQLQQYLGQSMAEIQKAIGPQHVDIGSGYFMPSYITNDGYLVSFTFLADDGVVSHVGKTDLFTGESVEWFLAEK